MHVSHSGVSRTLLALTLAVALAACMDEPMPTDPIRKIEPQFGVGDAITVTNTSGGTGIGSLRWAISQMTGGEVIRFDPSLAGKTIVLDTTVVTAKSVTIEGPAQGITISGGGVISVFAFVGSSSDTARIRNLTITGGKLTNYSGAGIYAHYTTLIVENSVITGNEAGAFPAILGEDVTLINTTVSGNRLNGTIVYPYAAVGVDELTMVNSTIAHNASAGVNGTMVMRNSVLSDNDYQNCSGTITREGNNISDDDSCGAPFEIIIADPLLGPLADNGGPGNTHALLAGSPAINGGTSCTVNVDQRYVARDAQCDLGAFEFIDFTTVQITMAASASIDKSNGWAVLTGTVKCSRNETFDLYVELHQTQKIDKSSIDVHAAATTPIVCSTSVLPWTIALVTTDEPFETGSGSATVGMLNAEPWIKPASLSQDVKLVRARK